MPVPAVSGNLSAEASTTHARNREIAPKMFVALLLATPYGLRQQTL